MVGLTFGAAAAGCPVAGAGAGAGAAGFGPLRVAGSAGGNLDWSTVPPAERTCGVGGTRRLAERQRAKNGKGYRRVKKGKEGVRRG